MKWLLLPNFERGEDFALLAFRWLVGAFLIWGVWDNIVSAARMAEFIDFLRAHDFPRPDMLAPLSVWVQFLCGAGFIAGLLTRWCGLLCLANFIVAIVMVDAAGGVRQAFPAAMLAAFGAYLATRGGGRYALDARLGRER